LLLCSFQCRKHQQLQQWAIFLFSLKQVSSIVLKAHAGVQEEADGSEEYVHVQM